MVEFDLFKLSSSAIIEYSELNFLFQLSSKDDDRNSAHQFELEYQVK